MINSMLISSGLPENLWGEALLSSCFILNRIPTNDSGKTPYELWKGRTPNLDFLKVWGCLAKVNIPESKNRKQGSKTLDAVFTGYAQNNNAYSFLVIKSEINDISNNTILEARDASFFEDIIPFKTKISRPLESEPSSFKAIEPELETEPELKSKRKRFEKDFGKNFFTFLIEGDPSTYDEVMTSSESSYWKEAIDSEIKSIIENKTWILTDLPHGNKPIGTKWIFKRKLRPDGSIERYKTRLVVKGFNQKDIDYFDTYAPIARITTLRTLIALASIYKLIIHQMDVKTIFLNKELKEEIYINQPQGFEVKG